MGCLDLPICHAVFWTASGFLSRGFLLFGHAWTFDSRKIHTQILTCATCHQHSNKFFFGGRCQVSLAKAHTPILVFCVSLSHHLAHTHAPSHTPFESSMASRLEAITTRLEAIGTRMTHKHHQLQPTVVSPIPEG